MKAKLSFIIIVLLCDLLMSCAYVDSPMVGLGPAVTIDSEPEIIEVPVEVEKIVEVPITDWDTIRTILTTTDEGNALLTEYQIIEKVEVPITDWNTIKEILINTEDGKLFLEDNEIIKEVEKIVEVPVTDWTIIKDILTTSEEGKEFLEENKVVETVIETKAELPVDIVKGMVSIINSAGESYSCDENGTITDASNNEVSLETIFNELNTYIVSLKSQLLNHSITTDSHPISSDGIIIENVLVMVRDDIVKYCQDIDDIDGSKKRVKYIFDFESVWKSTPENNRWGNDSHGKGCSIHMYINGNDWNPTISSGQPYIEIENSGIIKFSSYSGKTLTPIDIQYIDE